MLRYLLLVVLFLVAPLAIAQPATNVDLDALDAYIETALGDWPVPGLAVAIVKDGEVVHAKGYGTRTVGEDQPVDEHTLFAIASNTKAFTAALLAMLVDEGRLSWDDRVVDHLPYFELYDPYVTEAMRVRDLLSHGSGLGTYSGDLLWYDTDYTAEEVVRRARHLDPAGPFRASYGYSNLMVITAGEVIRAVTGQPWAEVVQARILDPLGMDRTVTSTNALPALANVATPHKPFPDSLVTVEWMNWDAMGAAGALISSVDDIALWMRLQLGGGTLVRDSGAETMLFSEAQQHTMWSPHTLLPISQAARARNPHTHFRAAALGWFVRDYHGRRLIDHGGGYDGMFSRTVLVPEENLGVVVLTNSMTALASALTSRVVDAYLGVTDDAGQVRDYAADYLSFDRGNREQFYARIDSATVDRGDLPPTLALDDYAATFESDLYGGASVVFEDAGLVLRFDAAAWVADLTHLHGDVFRVDWREEYAWFGPGNAQFVLSPANDIEELRLDVPNDDLWFYELELMHVDE
ncbi:MAG: serine hydrolase [Bacteroidota bacterium]